MKKMKRRCALLLAVLLALQLTAAVPARAADPTVKVTFLDENGNPILTGEYSYEGTEFDISKLDTYFPSLSSAEIEALGKAAEVKLETSYTGPEGPAVIAEDNAEGKPLTVTVTGDASRIKVGDGASVTFVGDFDAGNMDDAIHTVGDAEVHAEGNMVGHDHNIPRTGILAENAADSLGTEIPNNAEITFVGDVQGNPDAVKAEGNAHIELDGSVFGVDHAIVTSENAVVEFEGSEVRSIRDGVVAMDDSTVTVEGDVSARGTYTQKDEYGNPVLDSEGNPVLGYLGVGVQTYDTAEVNVTGIVSGAQTGVSAHDNSEVHVTGNVSGLHTENREMVAPDGTTVKSSVQAGTGIAAAEDAEVTVTGNVLGGSVAVTALDTSNVEIGGAVLSPGGVGIAAHNRKNSSGEEIANQSTVHVEGPVDAVYDGIRAEGESVITVDGDVIAGHTEIFTVTNASGEQEEIQQSYGYGINASDDAQVTVNSVTSAGSAVVARNSAEVHVKGDAVSSGSSGIVTSNQTTFDPISGEMTVESSDADVTVDGNVTSKGTAVAAVGGTEITIGGNVISMESSGITARDTSQVDVSGDVGAKYIGVEVYGGAEVTVDGSVYSANGTAVSVATSMALDPEKGEWTEPEKPASAEIGGEVIAANGGAVWMTNDSNVTIQGDVTGGQVTTDEKPDTGSPYMEVYEAAKEEAFSDLEVTEDLNGVVEIENSGEGKGKLLINGTVSANGEAVPLVINVTTEAETTEQPELKLPEMKIYEIEPGTDGTYFDVDVQMFRDFDVTYTNPETGVTETYTNVGGYEHVAIPEEEHEALIETIAAAIQYIIKIDPAYRDGTIGISNEFYDAENDLYAAHEGEEVSVTFNMDSSHELSASGNYTLRDNGDGTWTLTVQRGGGVTLTAVIRRQQIQQADQSPSGLDHPAVGKTVRFGKYDLDGNGEAEDLIWKIIRVAGGYARLAMTTGIEAIPEDFHSAFSEHEAAQIREGSLVPLDPGMAKGIFGDALTHPSMYVKMDALNLE